MSESEWVTVPSSTRRRNDRGRANGDISQPNASQAARRRQAQLDLRTFKTLPCAREAEPHDRKICPCYHSFPGNDRRRDPYATPYAPDDPSTTNVERAYHPLVFRTQLCKFSSRPLSCPFGDICAFAHSEADLRGQHELEAYEEEVSRLHHHPSAPQRGRAQVYEAVLAASSTSNPDTAQGLFIYEYQWLPEARAQGQQDDSGISVETLPLLPWQADLLQRRDSQARLLEAMESAALEHVCQLQLVRQRHPKNSGDGVLLLVQIQGLHAAQAKEAVRELLNSLPAHVAWVKTKVFPPRVFNLILEMLKTSEGKKVFGSAAVSIHADEEDCSLTVASAPGNATVAQGVFQRIEFWQKVEEPRYGELHCCECCLADQRNPDEGAMCPGGHFFCVVEPCFEMLVKVQLPNIRFQENGQLVCPVCDCGKPFSQQTCGKYLQESTYLQLLDAVVETKVATRCAELEDEFEQRLKEQVRALFQKHSNLSADDPLKIEAVDLAAQARDKALNLACPKCNTVYFDFEGCMALRCASCKTNFCAYCNKVCADSRGAHQHVRECDDNRTSNGSYYANAEQIDEAQRRLRIKSLKRFLRDYKKELQNAIVFELARDLASHGIDRGALLSVGDLMMADEPPNGNIPAAEQ